jgi:flagellar FliL protein
MADKDEKKADSGEEAPKSKKKLMIIIIVAVVVLLGGGYGGYLAFSPKSSSATAKAAATPSLTPGVVVVLDAITINLADGHYLKLKMSLQATADAGTAVDGSKALDLAIAQYSNVPEASLMSNAQREKTKAELLTKVEKAYKNMVMDIYFTTFVIQ